MVFVQRAYLLWDITPTFLIEFPCRQQLNEIEKLDILYILEILANISSNYAIKIRAKLITSVPNSNFTAKEYFIN